MCLLSGQNCGGCDDRLQASVGAELIRDVSAATARVLELEVGGQVHIASEQERQIFVASK